MENPLISDSIFCSNYDTLGKQICEFNVKSCSSENLFLNSSASNSFDSSRSNSLDKFSTYLLSKSELNANHNNSSINGTSVKSITSPLSQDHFDTIYRNSSSISFFRDLKDYFAQNLFEKLRKCVSQIYQNDIEHYNITTSDLITITPEELRDRALLLKRCMSTTDINIVQIYMALRERYNVIETGSVPSVGSLLHVHGFCKPCVFANKKSNYCKSGFGCNFCHFNHKASKSKSNSKPSFTKLSSQSDFFKTLIRMPRNEDSSLRCSTTDDDFSFTSSGTSLMSINDLKSSTEEFHPSINMLKF
ncbi:hypothetical protein MACJ_003016 [Theileria orientalis]|uniref:C3H1-type domain-containing protein n=1 Tax=Theileria orientalis TaxID=68886 RepID=A0A976QSS4_THEOR|nr:hypothetical protein MACJ_003016 [Theileria orientalis]